MGVNYASAKQVPPEMWAKAGQDSKTGDWHILMAARKEDIDEGGRGHDHYWKTGGKWYVQVKLSPDAGIAPHKPGGKHLFENNREFTECDPYYLDKLLDQL